MAPESEAAELQSLIREYGDGTNTTSNADVGKLAKAMQPVVDYVTAEKAQKQQAQFDTDLKDIVGFFSEEEGLKERLFAWVEEYDRVEAAAPERPEPRTVIKAPVSGARRPDWPRAARGSRIGRSWTPR